MIPCKRRLLTLLTVLQLPVVALWAEPVVWVLEGVITEADPQLAPDLQSGWVLSGSFVLDPLQMEEDIPPTDGRSGRLSGGLTDAELTVDLYHQLHFEAFQVPGMAGLDYRDNDPEGEGRDLMGWFIPARGPLKETEWTSRWLQVWLADSEGKMLRVVPPAIPPAGFDWKTGWFRLTFERGDGTMVYADGRIEIFAPEGSVKEKPEEAWARVAASLSRELVDRDRTIEALRGDLSQARARIESLRRMVDLMVEERDTLRSELQLLGQQASQGSPETLETIASLEADLALLKEEMDSAQRDNASLSENLAASEKQRRKLESQLEAMEQERQRQAAAESVKDVRRVPIELPEAGLVGQMTIVPEPTVIERPMLVERRVIVPQAPEVESSEITEPEDEPGPEEATESARTRRFGPRKFR